MDSFQTVLHLLSFFAPAVFVAVAVAFASRLLGRGAPPLRWWAQSAINFAAGLLALLAGLWHFGVDGKMATYAALVAAIATSQWICVRVWKT